MKLLPLKNRWSRWGLALVALSLLGGVYLFQRYDASGFFGMDGDGKFVINKTIRFLLNESACLLLIVSIFNQPKYLRVGFMLFLAELTILLPLYFILKLSLEGDSEISSPLLSQLHRMIVNPLLMFVLILGMFYQNFILSRSHE